MTVGKELAITHITLDKEISGYFNGGQLLLAQPNLLFGRFESKIKIFSLDKRKIVGTIEHL